MSRRMRAAGASLVVKIVVRLIWLTAMDLGPSH